jgi:alkylation response protein AidB-like acyl-CoA dehydrogenase
VQIRPTKQLSGESEFAEIFLDDVFVSDDDVVDDPSAGWSVAMTTFSFERAAIANGMLLERAMQALIDRARRLEQAGDPLVRQRLARLLGEVRAFSWLSLRDLTRYEAGAEVGADASLSKLGWSETGKRLRALAVELRGLQAVATGPDEADPWLGLWMWSVAQTIYGGTSEIQRNIVAERLLGLPRVP